MSRGRQYPGNTRVGFAVLVAGDAVSTVAEGDSTGAAAFSLRNTARAVPEVQGPVQAANLATLSRQYGDREIDLVVSNAASGAVYIDQLSIKQVAYGA